MKQAEQVFETESGRLAYLLGVPDDGQPEQRWPLIFFLHGRGERGDDLAMLKRHGIPRVVDEADSFPFITVSPQCPLDTDWEGQRHLLIPLLDDVMGRTPVDPARVYLTGLSMGGRGSWALAVTHPARFAAVAPICGATPHAPDFFDRLPVLKDKPLWVFHGAHDTVVPIGHSDHIVAMLRALGSNVHYTVYPDARHDAWTRTYANPELYRWFLEHTL